MVPLLNNQSDISRLCLGTVALGMDYGISNQSGKPTREEAQSILQTAVKAGVNFFDTARSYGTSEEILGDYFNQFESHPVIITKCRVEDKYFSNKEQVQEKILASIRSSLLALKLKSIPVLLFHKTIDFPSELIIKWVFPFLDELKKEGLIDKYGVSLYQSNESENFLNQKSMEAIQLPINVFDQLAINNGALLKFKEEGKIVFARSVFLQGLFFVPPQKLKGNLSLAKNHLQQLKLIVEQSGMGMAEFLFAFVNGLEGISSIVLGITSLDELKMAIELVKIKSIDDDIKIQIKRLFSQIPREIIVPGLWKN